MATNLRRPIRVAHVATIDLTLRVLLRPQLLRLRDEGFEVVAISAPGPSVQALEAEGIRHVPWRSATRAWNPRADLRAFAELFGILRRERFDVVHTHNAKPGVMGRVAARMAGVPCVVNTVHGFDARPDDRLEKRFAFMGLEWIAARFSDLELYQSSADLDRARRLRMKPPSRSEVLGNGVDLRRFDPARVSGERVNDLRRVLGIPPGSLVVGTVGRLVGDKGYRELFAAAREVRAAVPDVAFVAIGDRDPDKADAIDDQELARAGEHVVLTGWREDMPELLALMDVFVLATWREGYPRSAMEAAAMAKSLVLTDIPGCRQVARHGVEGFLVPPRDPGRLASAICLLLRDPALRDRMGAAARATALERFDETRVADLVVDRYVELLSSRGLLDGTHVVGGSRG